MLKKGEVGAEGIETPRVIWGGENLGTPEGEPGCFNLQGQGLLGLEKILEITQATPIPHPGSVLHVQNLTAQIDEVPFISSPSS